MVMYKIDRRGGAGVQKSFSRKLPNNFHSVHNFLRPKAISFRLFSRFRSKIWTVGNTIIIIRSVSSISKAMICQLSVNGN